jgi:hypothetical protein
VGSAQNAPLELYKEIATVRLLQSESPPRTFVIPSHAPLMWPNMSRPAPRKTQEKDGDAENGNTEFCGTAVERESHALSLALIPKEALCKEKIMDEGGAKGLFWVADSGALSGAPVVNGTSGNRVVARWSGTGAG